MGAHEATALGAGIAPIEALEVAAYRIPTPEPESDGTLEWSATTLVVVRFDCGGQRAIGYTYAERAAAVLIADKLAPVLEGADALDIPRRWHEMASALRNAGRPGVASMALAAADAALWDAKARILGLPLARLLGQAREAIPAYGSGGFTSYGVSELCAQLADWAAGGLRFVKMKVGRHAPSDAARVAAARRAIGPGTGLFVDANGAYARKQALEMAERFADYRVAWLEEPVSADDLEGLRLIRDRAPAGMAVSAGEYGYDLPYFRRMLAAGAVDVLQADATRCGGITGFLGAAALCEAHGLPLSSHCAPMLHLPLMCAVQAGVHLEYFHDHVRIEGMLFDGFQQPVDGLLRPSERPGLGIELKRADAERYRL